jgi:hypothetical protein
MITPTLLVNPASPQSPGAKPSHEDEQSVAAQEAAMMVIVSWLTKARRIYFRS